VVDKFLEVVVVMATPFLMQILLITQLFVNLVLLHLKELQVSIAMNVTRMSWTTSLENTWANWELKFFPKQKLKNQQLKLTLKQISHLR
jgi:hypothetical protein